VLQRAIAANLNGVGGGLSSLSPERRAQAGPALADAFGTAFWVACGLVAVALLPALLLPRALAQRDHDAGAY
jgi:hypothetical protein